MTSMTLFDSETALPGGQIAASADASAIAATTIAFHWAREKVMDTARCARALRDMIHQKHVTAVQIPWDRSFSSKQSFMNQKTVRWARKAGCFSFSAQPIPIPNQHPAKSHGNLIVGNLYILLGPGTIELYRCIQSVFR